MAKRGNPNLARRRRLATELRRLRELAGLTGQDVRHQLGWPSSSKLSRIEHGDSGIKPRDLEDLLTLYDVLAERRAELIALSEESQRDGVILPSDPADFDEQRRLLDAERDAESISLWEPQVFPGLFQIPAYSRALHQAWAQLFTLPPGGPDRRIEARQLRQAVLTRVPPPRLLVVIDESVLHRRIGEPTIMREQLAHVLTVSDLPSVDVRILPLIGSHVITNGAFNYFSFGPVHGVSQPDLVAIDHLAGTAFEDAADTAHRYAVAFESLRADALAEDESRALIVRAAADWTG
ncbi:MAG: helix-turn-helix domain-containing protein [Streptosporangiaceae bacterium]